MSHLDAAIDAYKAAMTRGETLEIGALALILDEARRQAASGDTPPPLLEALRLGDDAKSPELMTIRLRRLAERAVAQTDYYRPVFADAGLDPSSIVLEELTRLPLTAKRTLRERPYDFVCRDAEVAYRTHTSGTGGAEPVGLCFSAREMALSMYLLAIFNLLYGEIGPEDIYMIPATSRQVLSSTSAAGGLHLIGATALWSWLSDPDLALAHLTEQHRIPGKVSQVNHMMVFPSHLGEIVETGLAQGLGPDDFAVKQMDIGGEIATSGLKRRARALFGDDVVFWEGYGMSETWGSGGADLCPDGHLHFGTSGLWEFIDPDTGRPAGPGETAMCVATVLPPFRETTLLLRYETEDLVQLLDEPVSCGLEGRATSMLMGKSSLAIRHDHGWTYPRDILEALEDVDDVRLPARCGFWPHQGGVAVEVVAADDPAVRRRIGDSLEAHAVPVVALAIRESRDELERPYALRIDVKEPLVRA